MLPVLHQLLGTILVFFGLIVLPLPLPFGLIMLTIGFALLAPYMPPVQALIRFFRSRFPKFNTTLLRYRDRFPPVIKRAIDKTRPQER